MVGKVFSERFTVSKVELKLKSCPLSSKVDVLSIVVDNEASYSINPSIVPWDGEGRSMREALSIVRIIDECSHSNV